MCRDSGLEGEGEVEEGRDRVLPSWTRHTRSSQPSIFRSGSPNTYMPGFSTKILNKHHNRRPGSNNNWILGPETWTPATPKKDSRWLGGTFAIYWRPSPHRFVVVQPAMLRGARATNKSFFLDRPCSGRVADVALALIPPSMGLRRDTTIRFPPRAC